MIRILRKTVYVLTALALSATFLLSGCGSKEETPAPDLSQVEVAEGETADIPEPEEKAEEIPAETPEPEPVSWFEAHKLSVTKQGKTEIIIGAGEEGVEPSAAKDRCEVSIIETVEGCEEGHKKVICTVTSDVSESLNNDNVWIWISAFDRYTGTSFEYDGIADISYGDRTYDVGMVFKGGEGFPLWTDTLTVTCPEDYDGTVFQIGYFDSFLAEENAATDYNGKFITIDETPAFDLNGHEYKYFSYKNE